MSCFNDSFVDADWNVNTFENAKYLEFILSLKWSLLTENIKTYKDRISLGLDWTYTISNVKRNEEKLVLRITNTDWNHIYFTNFDPIISKNNIKKFHNISLIKEDWVFKAKVWIYIHKDLDRDIARAFLNNDTYWRFVDNDNFEIKNSSLKLKTAAYVYYWLNGKKIWKIIKLY